MCRVPMEHKDTKIPHNGGDGTGIGGIVSGFRPNASDRDAREGL